MLTSPELGLTAMAMRPCACICHTPVLALHIPFLRPMNPFLLIKQLNFSMLKTLLCAGWPDIRVTRSSATTR